MKYAKILLVSAVIFLLSGCAQSQNDAAPASADAKQTPAISEGTSLLNDPAALDAYAFGQIEKQYMKNCYNGLEAGSPYIKALLDVAVEKQKPIERFTALLTKVKKADDSNSTLTIDRVERNPNFDAGATSNEPYLVNKEEREETVAVGADAFVVLNTEASVVLDEKLNAYVGQGEHYFDFYTCEGEVLFIVECVMP